MTSEGPTTSTAVAAAVAPKAVLQGLSGLSRGEVPVQEGHVAGMVSDLLDDGRQPHDGDEDAARRRSAAARQPRPWHRRRRRRLGAPPAADGGHHPGHLGDDHDGGHERQGGDVGLDDEGGHDEDADGSAGLERAMAPAPSRRSSSSGRITTRGFHGLTNAPSTVSE